MVKRLKRKTGAGKQGGRQSKKQQEALHKLESKAAGTLRLFRQLRFLRLTMRLEKPLRELSRASEIDATQLRAVMRRFISLINEFKRQSGQPRMIKQNGDNGDDGGGNGDDGNGNYGNVNGGGGADACINACYASYKNDIAYVERLYPGTSPRYALWKAYQIATCELDYDSCLYQCSL
jgi:hypothetical protein